MPQEIVAYEWDELVELTDDEFEWLTTATKRHPSEFDDVPEERYRNVRPLVYQNPDSDDGETSAHAYCHDCDWYATPDNHDLASVTAAADAHATFHAGHTTTAGFSEETVTEACSRSARTNIDATE